MHLYEKGYKKNILLHIGHRGRYPVFQCAANGTVRISDDTSELTVSFNLEETYGYDKSLNYSIMAYSIIVHL